jgi:hypothetical protein
VAIPPTTRLRFVQAKTPEELTKFLGRIRMRVQIYGAPVWDGDRWTLWFVPPDIAEKDVKSMRIS